MYVVLCCTAKGSDTMAKRRPSGDGMVRARRRKMGRPHRCRSQKRTAIRFTAMCLPEHKKELIVKLHDCIEMYRDADLTEDSKMTLGEWLDRWINEYMIFTIRESTLDSYKAMIKNQIKPYLGDRPLSALTTQELQKFYNTVKKEWSGETWQAARYRTCRQHGARYSYDVCMGHSIWRWHSGWS